MQGQIDDPFAAIGIRPDGVLLHGDAVQPGDRPIHLDVENVGRSRQLQVITTCRGEIVEYQRFRQEQGVFDGPSILRKSDKHDEGIRDVVAEQTARKDVGGRRIEIASKLDGIHRVAVFEVADGDMTLLAERLIYRQPTHRLDVSAKLSQKTGNHTQFRVEGKDESGHPADFFGLASVVDDRFVDDQPEPSLTEQFLVLGDLRGGSRGPAAPRQPGGTRACARRARLAGGSVAGTRAARQGRRGSAQRRRSFAGGAHQEGRSKSCRRRRGGKTSRRGHDHVLLASRTESGCVRQRLTTLAAAARRS